MGNEMNFKNPFFESILFNQKSKYSLLNKNTFLGSYEEVIDSFHNNENLFIVLPDGFAYHENINFINYPNSEKIWDKEIGKFTGYQKVSLGEKWLQGHSCIAITQYVLDKL